MATISVGEIEATLRLRDELSQQLKLAQSNLAKTGDSLQRIGRVGKEAGVALTTGLTLPLVAAATAALKFSADFETAMTKVGTLTNLGINNITALRKRVLDLAPAVGIGPKALAEGLLVVASTGLDAETSMAVLEESAKASAVGLGEVRDVARSVTAGIVAYGEGVLDAQEATSKLFVAVREGGAEADEFAGSLGRVLGVAAQLGISFDEILASVATFTRVGVDADEAVTALRGTMSTLLKPSEKARQELTALGSSIDELRAQVREKGLAVALTDLVQKIGDNEDALGAIVPNVRALAGVLANAGSQGEEYVAILERIKAGGDEFDEAFQAMSKTLGFQWSQAVAKAQTVLLQLGDAIAPAFRAALGAIDPLLAAIRLLAEGFAKLPAPVQATAVAFLALAAAAGPIVFTVSSLIQIFGFVATAAAFLSTQLGLSSVAATGLSRQLGVAAVASVEHAGAAGADAIATAGLATSLGAASNAAKAFGAAELIAGMTSVGRAVEDTAIGSQRAVTAAKDLTAAWQLTQATGLNVAGTFKNVTVGMSASGRAAEAAAVASAGMSGEMKALTAIGIANAATYKNVVAGMSASGRAATESTVATAAAGRKWTDFFNVFKTGSPILVRLGQAFEFLTGPVGWFVGISAAVLSVTGSWDSLFRIFKAGASIIGNLIVGAMNRFIEVANVFLDKAGKVGTFLANTKLGKGFAEGMDSAAGFLEMIADGLNGVGDETSELSRLQKIAQQDLDKWSKTAEKAAANAKKLADSMPQTNQQMEELARNVRVLGEAGQLSPAVMAEVEKQIDRLVKRGAQLPEILQNIYNVKHRIEQTDVTPPTKIDLVQRIKDAEKAMRAFTDADKEQIKAGLKITSDVEKLSEMTHLNVDALKLYVDGMKDVKKATSFIKEHAESMEELTAKIKLATASGIDLTTQVELFGSEAEKSAKLGQSFGQSVSGEIKKVADAKMLQEASERMADLAMEARDAKKAMSGLAETGRQFDKMFVDPLGEALLKMQGLTAATKDALEPMTMKESLDEFFKMGTIEPPDMKDFKDNNKILIAQLDDLASAFVQIAQVSGDTFGGIVRDIANVITSFSLAKKAAQQLADARIQFAEAKKAGSTAGKVSSVIGGVAAIAGGVGAVAQATGSGSKAARTAGGALTGFELGNAILPGIGGVVGAVAGGLTGFIRGLVGVSDAVKETRKQQDDLIKSMRQMGISGGSNFQVLANGAQRAALAMGKSGEEARQLLEALMDTDHPERFNKALQEITETLDKLNKAVEKYGLTWKDLANPADRLQMFQDELGGLVDDFMLLQRAGYDTNAILSKMGDDFMRVLKDAADAGVLDDFIDQLVRAGRISREVGDTIKNGIAAAGPDFEELTQRAEKYGITLEQLGPKFQQAKISKDAKTLLKDFNDLVGAGAEINGVMIGMSDEVNTFLQNAKKFGSDLPTDMKPMLETFLNAGLLVDENGKKLDSLAGFSFKDSPLERGLKDLTTAINDLIITLGGVPSAVRDAARVQPDPIIFKYRFEEENGGAATGNRTQTPIAGTPSGDVQAGGTTGGGGFSGVRLRAAAQGGVITRLGVRRFADGGKVLPMVPRVASAMQEGGEIARLGVKHFAEGGKVLPFPSQPTAAMHEGGEVARDIVQHFAKAGMVEPMQALASGGRALVEYAAQGTDTVPAMLTPGEGVVTVDGMRRLGEDGLKALNSAEPLPVERLHKLAGVERDVTHALTKNQEMERAGEMVRMGVKHFAGGGVVVPFPGRQVKRDDAPTAYEETPMSAAWHGEQRDAPTYSGDIVFRLGNEVVGRVALQWVIDQVSRRKNQGEILVDLIKGRVA